MSSSDWGQWAVSQLKAYSAGSVRFGIQATAPLPLRAVRDLFKAISGVDRSNPFLPGGSQKPVFLVEKNDFAKLDIMDEEDIDADVLGFSHLSCRMRKLRGPHSSL
jgi:hypothetical protein